MPNLIYDHETTSLANLREVGGWRYATDDSTDVLCCAFAVDDGPIQVWRRGDPVPAAFFAAAQDPSWRVISFNNAFERAIDQHILVKRHGWPAIPLSHYRCLQASALSLALPAALDDVAKALKLEQQKDAAGAATMMRLARLGRAAAIDPPDFEALVVYCKQDVATECELFQRIGLLSDAEQTLWLLDAAINARGIHIDRTLLDAALRIAEEAQRELNSEIGVKTGLDVRTIGQTEKLMEWLAEHDCTVTDLKKGTLRHALRRKSISDEVRRVIELRLAGAHASASKLETMRAWLNDDDRVRNVFRFHGTSTGRWSSVGIQLQNLKRPETEDLGAAIEAVATGSFEHVQKLYPQPMSVVGDISRALITAAPGHRLITADYSGVESRITAWVSGQQSKLDQWSKYDRTQAAEDEPYYLLGRAIGFEGKQTRDLGKIADLAFGYQGGAGAWKKLAPADDQSTDDEIKARQRAWHRAHPATVRFWRAIDRAAVQAVAHPGHRFQCGRVSFETDGREFLRLRLPSGRSLAYPFPTIKKNSRGYNVLSYMDNVLGQWTEVKFGHGVYGGLLLENVVQAVARDVFAAAMARVEAAGYRVTIHVHDEICAEVPDGFGSTEEFLQIITVAPDWAAGLPIAAKVRAGLRFAKESGPASPGADKSVSTDDPGVPWSDPLNDLYHGNPAPPPVPQGVSSITPPPENAPAASLEASFIRTEPESPPIAPAAAVAEAPAETAARAAINAWAKTEIALADLIGQELVDGKIICPFHDDHRPSLHIYDDHYHCFACGAHGDRIDWLMHAEGVDRAQAAVRLAMTAGSRTYARRQRKDDERANIDRAARLWDRAVSIGGTLAERYLEARCIDVAALPGADVLRFLPNCPFNGERHPCLLALFRDVASDEPAGIHRIALTPAGEKLGRRMLGQWPRPRAIKFWPATSSLVIGEGAETVLTAATRLTHKGEPLRPAWSLGSSGVGARTGIASFPVVPGVEKLIVLVDHDANGVGQKAAEECATRWVAAGPKAVLLKPKRVGFDFNDVARAVS
jgi:CHC2 zinc finger/Toprim domain